jgi:UDP-N-acetylglucosamine 1-carboxyvinyltransferase
VSRCGRNLSHAAATDCTVLHAPNGFECADVDLLDHVVARSARSGPEYSGATKTAVLAVALGRGRSVLRNPYLKAELLSLLEVVELLGPCVGREGHPPRD